MISSLLGVKIRHAKNNLPVLKNSEIDAHAEALLRRYNPKLLSEPQEVDVEEFVEFYLRANLHYMNLSSNGMIWGRTVFEDTVAIVYNKETNEPTQELIKAGTIVVDNRLAEDARKEHAFRSTVAHEGGHFLYHGDYYHFYYIQHFVNKNQLSFDFPEDKQEFTGCSTFCNSDGITGGTTDKRNFTTDIEWLEHHAKHFSAAILMPESAVYMLMSEFHEKAEIMMAMSDIFNVSMESAQIRFDYLTEKQRQKSRIYTFDY